MDIAAFASTMATKARDRASQPNDLTSGETSGSLNGATAADARATKLKSFMGKTPSAIKSKFLSVLGNSTEIINGISNKVREGVNYLHLECRNLMCYGNIR